MINLRLFFTYTLIYLHHLHKFEVLGRIHKLTVEHDSRKQIDITTFGLLKGGFISVNVTGFKSSSPSKEFGNFGFTLDKTISSGMSNYFDNGQNRCILKSKPTGEDDSESIVRFRFDLNDKKLLIERQGKDFKNLVITPINEIDYSSSIKRRRRDNSVEKPEDDALAEVEISEEKSSIKPMLITTRPIHKENNVTNSKEQLILNSLPIVIDRLKGIQFNFKVKINGARQQGLYSLIFHNCLNYNIMDGSAVSFTVHITEKNIDNYLSADEMPLPLLFIVLSGLYFLLGCLWFCVVKSSKEGVFKIHYLMLSLVFFKSIALLFHSINFYFIKKEGHHEEAFAILFYITHLMKGALLFITLVLVGAGWAFVKHILSKRDKKIFIIVIPLQIFANIAQIIIEETEEGQSQYTMWREVFTLVDLLCCGAILFPVVWSIKHLQEASQTDGKAALNLAKLKIFRHFYIMIVCYIYFTRIIVYLIKITVPFNFGWIDELFREIATFLFFFFSGYKFRPASNNPYLQVSNESDEEVEMDEVLTQNGAFENITKVNIKSGKLSKPDEAKNESGHEFD